MRPVLAAACLATWPVIALAETEISAEIADTGITPTLARLTALPAPSDEEKFAIAGLEFLGALERVYQLRWDVGMPEGMDMMFGMAGDLPQNPGSRALDPAEFTALLDDTLSAMDRARTAMAAIPEGAEFGLTLRFADLWVDLDRNGERAGFEDFSEIVGRLIWGWQWANEPAHGPLPEIRFDAADVPWLAAYTHLVSGSTEMLRAYDPAPAIERVSEARRTLRGETPPAPGYDFSGFIDTFAILDGTLRHEPDAVRTGAAREHFLAMVAENRRFWTLVATETDNDREWIPNDTQVSATGIPFPKGIGATWLGVLDDAEGLLTGRLAAPYWEPASVVMGSATPPQHGIDLSRLFTEPRPVDIVGWIQGWAVLPYLSDAPTVSFDNLQRFERLVSGQAPLFMVFLN